MLYLGKLVVHEGDDYTALRPTIAVCFLDTSLFSALQDYHLVFELRERLRQELFTDQLAVHILELPKFHKELSELTTPLDRWLYFLRHGEELDAQAVPVPLDVPEVRWALGDLFMISRTDPDRELYEARLKERRDKAALWDAALAEGRAAGRAEGRAEGQAELRRADIHREQTRRGLEVTSMEELQKLSLDELEKIWAALQTNRLDRP